jgi:hypothetical protein
LLLTKFTPSCAVLHLHEFSCTNIIFLRSYDWNQFSDPEFMGQVAFTISSVPETPVIQVFDVKQHSMKKPQDKSLGSLQLIMMRFYFCVLFRSLCSLEIFF